MIKGWGIRILLTAVLVIALSGCGFAEVEPTPASTRPSISGDDSPAPGTAASQPADEYAAERQEMVAEVQDWGIQDQAVLGALGQAPRHEFVSLEFLGQAYDNHPLPIGYGQTISQPYIVALMTQELGVESGDRVLEIGTGSGYQAAILAELGVEVFTIEIIEALADQARARMDSLGYENVNIRHADGYFGWPEHAPYDAIIVTAAPDHVPQPLIQQLGIGGVMVVPIGPPGGYQELWRITKAGEDQVESVSLGGVRFVPLVREGDA